MISVKEATSIVLESSEILTREEIKLESALNRYLAENIKSDRDYPPFNRSAMDGIAIKFDDIENGLKSFKIQSTIFPGENSPSPLVSGNCFKIMTGAAVPSTADTVIRVENLEIANDQALIVGSLYKRGQNIAKKGEDTLKDSVILTSGTKIKPIHMGVLSTVGASTISVYRNPKINILTTGNEIKKVGDKIESNEIRDSNSIFLKSAFKNIGLESNINTVGDSKDKLCLAVKENLDCDIFILTGGVSMGDADFVPEILEKLGVNKLFHKVAQKPGKPIWFGKKGKTVVFGLPGNPVSVQVMFKLYIEPLLLIMSGDQQKNIISHPLAHDLIKKGSFRNFIPCLLNAKGEISTIKYNGSGDIKATAYSDGLMIIPEELNHLNKGDKLNFIPW